jgi:hypothetical protein
MGHTRLVVSVVLSLSAVALAQPRPPAEALAACSGLTEGTACGFTHGGRNLTGTCRAGPNGEAPACLPALRGGRGFGPPPEAFSACAASSAGASCTVTFPDGKTANGTCRAPPDGNGALACAPSGGPGGHRGPPPEAVSACSNQSSGAACSFTHHDRSISGTCRAAPDDSNGALACVPEGGPRGRGPGGHHGPPPEALAACASSSAGASCTVTLPDGKTLSGACVAGPEGQALACLPAR